MTSEGAPLELDKVYTLAVKYYLASGKDGYESLALNNLGYLVERDVAPTLLDIVTKFFESIGPNGIDSELRQRRLKQLNTNDQRQTNDGFIIISPQCDPRIVNLAFPGGSTQ